MTGTFTPPKGTRPKGIAERAAAADKRLDEISQGTPPVTTETPAPAPAAPPELPIAPAQPTPAPATETTATPEPPETPAPTLPNAIQPVAAPPTPPAPGPKPGEAPADTIKRLTHALEILQGKYNKEVPQIMRDRDLLKNKVSELEIENGKLKTAAADFDKKMAAVTTAAPTAPTAATVTDSDVKHADIWGVKPEEVAAFRMDIVNAVMANIPKPAEPASKTDAYPAVAAASADPSPASSEDNMNYLQMLDALIGDGTPATRLQTVKNPRFSEFLELYDEGTQKKIMDIAAKADAEHDAIRMSEVYQAFFQWEASASKPPVTDNSHLMPTAHGGGGAGDLKTDKKPIYSQAQVDEFKHQVQRGDFRTIGKSADEAKAIAERFKFLSNEFEEARKDGRIRG
jgi:hypothetical protein